MYNKCWRKVIFEIIAIHSFIFKIYEYDVDEPLAESVKEVSKAKVLQAYNIMEKPYISKNNALQIDELNRFPNTFI